MPNTGPVTSQLAPEFFNTNDNHNENGRLIPLLEQSTEESLAPSEMQENQTKRPSRPRCDHLDLVSTEETFACLTCNPRKPHWVSIVHVFYCEECIFQHIIEGHKVVDAMGCAAPRECRDHGRLQMMFCEVCDQHICRQCAFYCDKAGHPLVGRNYDLVRDTRSHFAQLQKLEAPMAFRKELVNNCKQKQHKMKSSYDLDTVVQTVYCTYKKVLMENAPLFRGIVTSKFPIRKSLDSSQESDLDGSGVSNVSQHGRESEKEIDTPITIKGMNELQVLQKHLESMEHSEAVNLGVTNILAKTAVDSQLEELDTHVCLEGVDSLESLVHKSIRLVMQSIKVPEIQRVAIEPLLLTENVPLFEEPIGDYIVGGDGGILAVGTIENEYLTVACYGVNGNMRPIILKTDFFVLRLSQSYIRILACNEYVCISSLNGTGSIYRMEDGQRIVTKAGFKRRDFLKVYQGEDGNPRLMCWDIQQKRLEFHVFNGLDQENPLEAQLFKHAEGLDTMVYTIKLSQSPLLVAWHGKTCAVLDLNKQILIFSDRIFVGKISSLQHGMCQIDQMEFYEGVDRLILCDHSNRLVTICAQKDCDAFISAWFVEKVYRVDGHLEEDEGVRQINSDNLEKLLVVTNMKVHMAVQADNAVEATN